jgi:hypothetical protein
MPQCRPELALQATQLPGQVLQATDVREPAGVLGRPGVALRGVHRQEYPPATAGRRDIRADTAGGTWLVPPECGRRRHRGR